MKKIGFIDYYLDEWHANNYPEFFEKETGGEMKVCYAYGKIDSPVGGMTNKEWSEKYNIPLASSVEELIEKSDCIIVLSPDNPEMHLELTDLALKSKKPVYIDKPFSLKKEEAETMFKKADIHGTPCCSSSALFYSNELKAVKKEGITRINSVGGGTFEIYAVHQLEQIVYLMGYDAKRVMYLGEDKHPALLVEFSGGRFAQLNFFMEQPFGMKIGYKDGTTASMQVNSDFWKNCTNEMAEFFRSQTIPVEHMQTITVAAITEAGIEAKANPFKWIDVK